MRLLLVLIATTAAAQTLTITPAVLTRCNANGLATANLLWRTTESAVQVHVLSPTGPAMTGFEPGNSGAATGEWVSDGMVFVLVNANGQEVARATAVVRCSALSPSIVMALASQPYLPLEVGNRWVYRYSDRFVTAQHLVRTVDRTVVEGGETWYVVKDERPGQTPSETLWRTDSDGRIYRNGVLFLDPATAQQRNLTVSTPFGSIPNGIFYTSMAQSLISESGTYARGLGLVAMQQSLLTGSSGGFTNSLDLVEAVISGKLRFQSPANGLELSPEFQTISITGRQARNCALPCYFAACGLGGGQPDPPGTYKPCIFTRLKVENPAARSLSLELVSAANESIYAVERPLTANEQLWFETIPLYRTAALPLPLGQYKLKVTVKSEQGEVLNTSTAALQLN